MGVWKPEVVVDEALARRLLAQFPQLEVDSLRPIAEGWDTAVWAVNERWAFRFPRREVVVPGIERELAVLPSLAPMLPLPVPNPVFVGAPADGYRWPFYGTELLPGAESSESELDDDVRVELAVQLAGFLRTLHGLELAEPLPVDVNGRADMSKRVPMALAELEELETHGLWRPPARVRRLLEDALQLPPPEPPRLVHGDLHFRQVLVEGRAVTGVIDWIDVCRSDSAIDLPLLWGFVPPEGRSAVLDAYGPVSDTQLLRARVLAFNLWAVLARYAHVEGFPSVEREALAGLDRAAVD